MSKFNHIGIFVKNLSIGSKFFSKIINIKKIGKEIIDRNLKVRILFITDNKGITYELVAPYGKNNPVSKLLSKNKNILNHVAYSTKHFDFEIKKLRKNGCIPLGEPKTAKAFNGSRVIFFLVPLGFIFELIEDRK